MGTTWETTQLGSVCRIIPGYAFKSSDWKAKGIPVVKIKNISSDNSVDLLTTDFVSESILTPRLEKFVLKDGDILLAMTGATAGKVGRVRTKRELLLNQRVAKIAPFQADPDFIWAVVSSQEYQELFYRLADGSAQPNMSGGQIEGVEIPLPSIGAQQRIAGILSAYDELIENNQRRIKILESMARALYREWFVYFRYPGHKSVPLVPSTLGNIPQGWEVTTLGHLVNMRKGKNITKATIREGIVPVVAGGLEPAYFHDVPNTRGPVITVSASGANAGYVNLYHTDVWASDCSYIDSTATEQIFYYYLWLDHRRTAVTHLQRGSAQPHVYTKDLEELASPRIPEEILSTFCSQITPIFNLVKVMTARINILRTTRDALLPRLLSGQIEVSSDYETGAS